jgi:hypothetical protein
VKALADVHKKTDPKPDVYAMSPVVMEEFVRFIHATKTPDKALVNQIFGLIDRFLDEIKPE